MLRLLPVAALACAAVPAPAPAAAWQRPVPGEVARAFALSAGPFAAGQHRGADLAAAPGTHVRAACSGTVVFAGRVPGQDGRVVSQRCGHRRVTYLPLASVAARRGRLVLAGAPVGTVGTGHGGLHLGVRREGRRFGYVDPMALLRRGRVLPTALRIPRVGPPGRPPRGPRGPARPRPRPVAAPPAGLAPLPAWVGLGLLLAGTGGLRTVARRRSMPSRGRRPVSAIASCDPPRP